MRDLDRLRFIFEQQIPVTSISEPITWESTDISNDQLITIATGKSFDTLPLVNPDGKHFGYIEECNGLWERFRFSHDELISDSTPLSQIIGLLLEKKRLFVIESNTITQIVTVADLEKMPIRIWLFGTISLLEVTVKNYLRMHYEESDWCNLLPENRLSRALSTFKVKREKNAELTLLDCLYLIDLCSIMTRLELHSSILQMGKKEFHSCFQKVETLRNTIAHGDPIDRQFGWNKVLLTVNFTNRLLTCIDEHQPVH